jgi:hypothetical protein
MQYNILPPSVYLIHFHFVCVFTGDQDEDKVGECPSVRNDTGICLQNCTYDKECAGNQKCNFFSDK